MMRADDWMVDYLIHMGSTDVFGIPGVVIMDFLYALGRRKGEIASHLCFHEQGASFSACGYSQIDGRLGVAYSTRGPGFTNMITAMADAFCDSIPVLFITAHSNKSRDENMRVWVNQEIDTVSMVRNVTKFATRIDDINELKQTFAKACGMALEGRKGPVFLDVYSGLFGLDVEDSSDMKEQMFSNNINGDDFVDEVVNSLYESRRPIFLIGNAVRSELGKNDIREISKKNKIPILSSRVGQDILPKYEGYFGYVGSHAQRYSNFILSKTDLIISLGNRLAYPTNSESFSPISRNAKIIRVDIDNAEFNRQIENSKSFQMKVDEAIMLLSTQKLMYRCPSEWVGLCQELKECLHDYDINFPIRELMKIMQNADKTITFTCDVGNHGFWVSLAYAYSEAENRILYSGSFGTLGSALPKAIGAYYYTREPVICFVGDQGFQFNIQELQVVSANKLPISIVILNNRSSGMIKDRQDDKYGKERIHTTLNDGYSFPDFCQVAKTYRLNYTFIDNSDVLVNKIDNFKTPQIIEIVIDAETKLFPYLPKGRKCQDLQPEIPRELYRRLDEK